jgi:hypothetical protein
MRCSTWATRCLLVSRIGATAARSLARPSARRDRLLRPRWDLSCPPAAHWRAHGPAHRRARKRQVRSRLFLTWLAANGPTPARPGRGVGRCGPGRRRRRGRSQPAACLRAAARPEPRPTAVGRTCPSRQSGRRGLPVTGRSPGAPTCCCRCWAASWTDEGRRCAKCGELADRWPQGSRHPRPEPPEVASPATWSASRTCRSRAPRSPAAAGSRQRTAGTTCRRRRAPGSRRGSTRLPAPPRRGRTSA